MDPEALTTALFRYRPKMVYVSPTLTDPEGACWSPENKTAVQSRCKEAGVLLVTDDRHEMLIYDQAELRPPRRLEPGALSIGQIPPGLIAGLRIGWIAGATESVHSHSNGTPAREEYLANTIEQLALAQLIEEQPLEPLYDMLRVQCAERMKRMTEQLARKGIEDLSWVQPKAGSIFGSSCHPDWMENRCFAGRGLRGSFFSPGRLSTRRTLVSIPLGSPMLSRTNGK